MLIILFIMCIFLPVIYIPLYFTNNNENENKYIV